MKNEMDVLKEVFGPDEEPSMAARNQARAALLMRPTAKARRRPRWAVRITAVVATAAAAAVGVVALENVGSVEPSPQPGADSPVAAALPFAKPAKAAEVLENAAWTASRRPWVQPRADQFMYVETISIRNNRRLLEASPNGPLVPGKTERVRTEEWTRIDGDVQATRRNGKLEVMERGREMTWFTIPYADLSALTTAAKVDAWVRKPKDVGSDPDALLMQQVLPPDVEAAFYRWLAGRPGVRVDPDAVNLDGRPAIALTLTIEGYLQSDLLFDPETYALIGDRLVAVKDHTSKGDDGTRKIRAGDVFRLVVRGDAGIVNAPGDTA